MIQQARRIIRNSARLYSLYCKIRGKSTNDFFPDADTNLHLTGYPRSANTFAVNLLRALDPDLRVTSHGHVIATLKTAKKFGVKTVVLIRRPLDAVSSKVVQSLGDVSMDIAQSTKNALRDYIDHYRYVKKYAAHWKVLDFQMVTKSPSEFANLIAAIGVMEPKNAAAVKQAYEDVMATMSGDSRSPEKRNLANPIKEEKKTKVKELLQANTTLKLAQDLYHTLSPIQSGALSDELAGETDV